MHPKLQQIGDVATGLVNGILITEGKPDVYFKKFIQGSSGNADQIFVVGSVHRTFNDGYCVAVLNPDESLVDQLKPAVAYSDTVLKDLVKQHCEAMVYVTCIGKTSAVIATYRARGA